MKNIIIKIKTKKSLLSMLLLTILALSSITIFTPSTQADDRYHHTTYILAAATPSPIGVGQTIYLTYLIENVPPAVLPTSAPSSITGAESP